MLILAYILGKLADPIAIVAGSIVGGFSRRWWHIAIAVIPVGVAVDIAIAFLLAPLNEPPIVFIEEVLAIAIWATAIFAISSWTRRRAAGNDTSVKLRVPHRLGEADMNMVGTAGRRFWNQIAIVSSGIWVGGTYLFSLVQEGHEFEFWDDRYNGYEPNTAFWFALIGVILIIIVCKCIPWIEIAPRPRPFWNRVGITGSSIWIGTTILYSLLHSDSNFGFGISTYDSDNGLWFALVGGAIVYCVCWSVPWITGAARSQ